jgi:hypothetical protein
MMQSQSKICLQGRLNREELLARRSICQRRPTPPIAPALRKCTTPYRHSPWPAALYWMAGYRHVIVLTLVSLF